MANTEDGVGLDGKIRVVILIWVSDFVAWWNKRIINCPNWVFLKAPQLVFIAMTFHTSWIYLETFAYLLGRRGLYASIVKLVSGGETVKWLYPQNNISFEKNCSVKGWGISRERKGAISSGAFGDTCP
jgi:hypothetical protein